MSDRIWGFVGISLVITISSAVFTLLVSLIFFQIGGETAFVKPLFLSCFGVLMVLQVLFPKLLASAMGVLWRVIGGLFTHGHR